MKRMKKYRVTAEVGDEGDCIGFGKGDSCKDRAIGNWEEPFCLDMFGTYWDNGDKGDCRQCDGERIPALWLQVVGRWIWEKRS